MEKRRCREELEEHRAQRQRTEYGMYISHDGGNNWKNFQLNLPVVPITDLALKDNDLVIATQGRSFWVLDDLSVVQQLGPGITDKPLHVFSNPTVWRMAAGSSRGRGSVTNAGANPPNGIVINYFAKQVQDSTKGSINFYDKNKKLVRSFATDAKETTNKIEINQGMNQFAWNLLYPEAERIEGMVLWNGVINSMKCSRP